jgi:nucleoside phosphorylase
MVSDICDVGIICALRNPELEAVLMLGDRSEWQEVERTTDDAHIYYRASWTTKCGTNISVIASSALQMGMSSAAILATKMILRFRPRLMIMPGIAAGSDPVKQGFGDIVFADQTFEYTSGKIAGAIFKPDPRPLPVQQQLVELAKSWENSPKLLAQTLEFWPANRPNNALAMHIGTVGSGAAVVENREIVMQLQNSFRKLVGVDMEAHGVHRACEDTLQTPVHFACTKAISDFAESKSDTWRPYAAHTSANFCYHFITNEWARMYPSRDRGAASPARSNPSAATTSRAVRADSAGVGTTGEGGVVEATSASRFREFFGQAAISIGVRLVFAHRQLKPGLRNPWRTFHELKAIDGEFPCAEGVNAWLSAQDVRASIYAANTIFRFTGRDVIVIHDKDISGDIFEFTAISFGLGFNAFTHRIANWCGGKLFSIEFGASPKRTFSSPTDLLLVAGRRPTIPDRQDIAVIARVVPPTPSDSPRRVCFVCAGRTAPGTAAAGYYLARHWESLFKLYEKYKKDLHSDSMVAVIQHSAIDNQECDLTGELAWEDGTEFLAWGRARGVSAEGTESG